MAELLRRWLKNASPAVAGNVTVVAAGPRCAIDRESAEIVDEVFADCDSFSREPSRFMCGPQELRRLGPADKLLEDLDDRGARPRRVDLDVCVSGV